VATTGYIKNFVVKNGITTGNITLDASSGNITGTNLSVTGISNLGAIANVLIAGGTIGQSIVTDGAGNLSFATAASTPAPMPTYIAVGDEITISANYQGLFGYPITIDGTMTVDGVLIDVNDNGNGGGGNGTPGGSNTQIQYNDAGSFGGNTGFTFDKTTGVFSAPSIVVSGNITPSANITYSLGNSTNRFNNLYLAGNTIDLGGAIISANATAIVFTNPQGGTFAVTGNSTTSDSNLGNVATANYFVGSGNGLSNVQGANVSGAVSYATTANSVAVANVTGIGNISTVNLDGNSSTVLYGNGVFSPVPAGGYDNSNVATFLASYGSNTITTTGNVSVGNIIGNGQALTNIAAGNIIGAVAYATTANSVAVANVTGIGNIATTNYNGNGSQVLAGNGYWVAQSGGGGSPGGSNTEIQFNDAGSFGGNTAFTFNKTTGTLVATIFSGSGNALSNIQGANVSGAVSYATTANAVAGANVSGQVPYAETANSVAGANVSGVVANATYATSAGTADTVTTNAQPNITSTGTLTSLSVSGNSNVGNLGTTALVATGAGSFGANVNMNTYWVNNVGYPVANTDAASKQYVDTLVSSGISYHQPVNVATTTTLATATGGATEYNSPNGAANGIGAYISTTGTFLNIDGANVQTVGTRILVKDEANATWNGVYVYSNTTAITRSTDTDEAGAGSTELLGINDYFFTLTGSVNAGTGFIVSAPPGTIIFGTSNIIFSTFSTSQVYEAGTGINITGTVISANASQTQITAVGTLTSLSVSGNANVGNIGATNGDFTYISGNGANVLSITGAHVTGQVSYAAEANAVAVANVTGIGNIATINLNGNGSQVLAGNGVWVAQTGGGGGGSSISNGTSNVNIATSGGNVTITANSNTIVTVTETGANITGNVNLGNVGNVRITGGTNGYLLTTDGTGNLTWAANDAITGIQEFNASASQTTFTVSGGYTVGAVLVFVNGIQMNNGDYTATNGTTVILTEPRVAGDVVRIISSIAAPSFNVSSIQNFSVAMSIALGI
jgi:hypothetical protein